MACPQCGSEILGSVAAHYEAEVRKPDADPQALDPLAPPSRKAILHGVIFGFFIWLGVLAPFFAPEGAALRSSAPLWILALIWLPLFLRARRQDRVTQAAYHARRFCESCGWYDRA
ncbi:MAG TPA: hypothetical protein VFT46_09280 [Holophagaceae bacterium]|nr:hypothetical protein [Holophagaceae bacterium]